MRKLTYKEKFIQMGPRGGSDRHLRGGHHGCLLGRASSPEGFTGNLIRDAALFSVSCLGGYVLSVVAVIFLVKRYFRDFDLDQDAPEESETTKGDAA